MIRSTDAPDRRHHLIGKRWLAITALLGLALTLGAACGDDDDDDTEVTTDDDDAADDDDAGEAIDISGIEELEDGTLSVLTNAPYPPLENFGPGGETDIIGFDPDLAAALGEKLGVEVEMIQTGFDAIIEELNAGDGDVVMSAMTIDPERDEQVDFVPYLSVGTGIAAAAGNPEGITVLEDLCGLAVSVQEATIQEDQLRGLNEDQCADNQIELVVLADQGLVTQELAEGNVDAMMADLPVILDAAATFPDEIEAADYNQDIAPYGIAYVTDSALGDVLQQAFDAVVEDGTYQELLETWGLEEAALVE
jgi:polar amino acid transport system substrate-binding protein